MANIIGEPINSIISGQIKIRQEAHGSGSPGNERTPEYHSYLNSKTAWFKLASATVVDEKRLTAEGLDTYFTGIEFSRKHVLYSGMSRVDLEQQQLIPKGTRDDINNIWDYYDGTYTVNASADRANNISEFGLVPMPGVESVDIQCLNRGSIKKASVKIKCYSPQQFKILDLLYLRIGYTVFLEWGWAPYLKNNGTLVSDYYTLIEQKDKGFFDWEYWKKQGYRPFLTQIEKKRREKYGNYDGLLCKVTNFSWTFAQDGTYDIDLQLITLGDVVESLKTNITPNRKMLTNISSLYKIFNDTYVDEEEEKEAKENPPSPIQDWISSYFFLNKLALFQERDTYGYWYKTEITCKIADVPINVFGVFLNAAKRTEDGISQSDYKYFWLNSSKDTFISELKEDGFKELDIIEYATTDTAGSYYSIVPLQGGIVNALGWIVYYSTKIEVDEIFKEQAKKDMVYIHWNSEEGDEDVVNNQGFYIRFGHLLQIINKYIIPLDENSLKPIIEISTGLKENKMYIFPYQVSLDPRVCIISNYNEPVNSKEYYLTLEPCKILSTDNPYGRTMNIYLNCQKVEEIISSNLDDSGNLDLFSLLENICSELNKALGGINNFEPVIDETTNVLYIVDGSYSEPHKPEYALELYGYNQSNPSQQNTIVSNFVRDFSIKTELTNDFATMATVGSTAGGYVKGTENTMFSKWNKGLTDRFKEKLTPADPESRDKSGEIDEPNEIYVKEFWSKRYNAFGLTAPKDIVDDSTTDDTPNISPEMCDKNVSLVTEFYKYCHSKIQENSENPSSIWYREKSPYASAVNGFIPISLSITLDGISGIKIYNELNVITRFLPQNYPDSLRFIIKGVNHKLSGNDWETTIETVVIAQNGQQNSKDQPIFTYDELRNQIRELISEGITAAAADEAEANGGSSSAPGGASSSSTPKGSGVYSNPPLPTSVRSETGSDLEKYAKEAASEQFAAAGSVDGLCGGYTYRMAERLAQKLTKKSTFPGTGKGGNHAYSSVLREHLSQLGIYKPESTTPIATGLPPDQAKNKINELTKKADYGDVLVYFMTPPPQYSASDNARFHAQFYTGNLYTKLGSKGWSTSNYNNYKTNMVYGTGDPYSIYWFRIKDEYKGLSSSKSTPPASGKSDQEESASGFNNLTYMLSLIYKLKDNYGKDGKPLFVPYIGNSDDTEGAIKALNAWFKTSKPDSQYKKLKNVNGVFYDKSEFDKYFKELKLETTETFSGTVTFQSTLNKKVKVINIDSDFERE